MKLRETIQNPLEQGIILTLKNMGGIDLLDATEDLTTVNAEYYLNHSGEKWITRMYEFLLKEQNMTQDEALEFMATTVKIRFTTKWNRLYQALVKEYDPLANYSMKEKENIGSQGKVTTSGETGIAGFDEDSYSKANNSEMSSETTGDFDKNKRELTREGNIGVTTSQQMLQSEIDVRKYSLYNQVYKDIDSILCQDVY